MSSFYDLYTRKHYDHLLDDTVFDRQPHRPSHNRPVPDSWRPPSIPIVWRDLPRLPRIHNKALLLRVFTDRSFLIEKGYDKDAAERKSLRSLEYEGDRLLNNWAAQAVLRSGDPGLTRIISALSSRLTSNRTFSHLTLIYRLDTHFIQGSSCSSMLNDQKRMADIFEAYIGASYRDAVNRGPDVERLMCEWLLDFFDPIMWGVEGGWASLVIYKRLETPRKVRPAVSGLIKEKKEPRPKTPPLPPLPKKDLFELGKLPAKPVSFPRQLSLPLPPKPATRRKSDGHEPDEEPRERSQQKTTMLPPIPHFFSGEESSPVSEQTATVSSRRKSDGTKPEKTGGLAPSQQPGDRTRTPIKKDVVDRLEKVEDESRASKWKRIPDGRTANVPIIVNDSDSEDERQAKWKKLDQQMSGLVTGVEHLGLGAGKPAETPKRQPTQPPMKTPKRIVIFVHDSDSENESDEKESDEGEDMDLEDDSSDDGGLTVYN